ncbi:MAG TPA: response regulator [Chitinophagaceae bacterium]|nr:response regulator [Chitinophagaceae bacterium]
MKILLIEDDKDDVELLQEALDSSKVAYEMKVLTNGYSALEYIGTCTDSPHIIVLDYNLPKVHGRELLKEIKNGSILKDTPLVVLTTSSSTADLNFAYDHGADKYLIKPSTTQEIKTTVQTILSLARDKKPLN